MAKTRVYELARDLNLTDKILLSKLNELDISVKSHMSSLDDEAVAKVKTVIYGKKEESIVETRIKPTVIRRRKKKVPLELVVEPTAESVEKAAESETAAEAVESEATPVEQQPAEVEEALKTPDKKLSEEPVEVDEKIAEEPIEEVAAEPAMETPEKQEAPTTQVKPPVPLKDKKPKKVAAKTKKEAAAKIIQLPVKPVEKPPERKVAALDKPKGKVEPMPQ